VIRPEDIRRLHLGHFTVPLDVDDHRKGQKIVVVAYLVRHPDGLLLFDTGIGEGHQKAEEIYRPVRRPLREALEGVGVEQRDVRLIVNCHLHFDHSGGNHRFPGTPIFAQRVELDAARRPDYTIREVVADFPGATFELLDGEAEPLPGVRIVPTPGHVDGHQSLLVDTTAGRVFIAGQAFNEASAFSHARYAWELRASGTQEPLPSIPDWIERIQAFDPRRVVFAHDLAVWDAAE
jgi:glyoxylase-like metal-dependent hydrolase (beta-lactamase superfamily II)